MEEIFVGSFAFGAFFTLVTSLLGAFHLLPGTDSLPGADVGHTHVGGVTFNHHHSADSVDPAGDSLPMLLQSVNFSAVANFLAVFGATGWVMLKYTPIPGFMVGLLAVLPGFAAAQLIVMFTRKLKSGETSMNPADYQLEGTVCKVTVTIPEAGVGEVVFAMAGTRRAEAARSANGQPIARETEVVITQYDRGVATVEPWSEVVKS